MSSLVLKVKAPGICVFCFVDFSGEVEVSEPIASAVTVTASVCEGAGVESWARICFAQLAIKRIARKYERKGLIDLFIAAWLPFCCRSVASFCGLLRLLNRDHSNCS